MKRVIAATTLLFLAGCGGGGGGGSSVECAAVGGSATAGNFAGSVGNIQNAVDGNLSTFASVSSAADGQVIAAGKQFNGGSNTGLFITPPSGTSAASMVVSTRMDGTVVESATGPNLVVTPTTNTAATNYVGFNSTKPFNQIEFRFPNGGEYLFFEFCGSAKLR